jgi:polar amino acid transport system substrate-binding protein
MKFGPILKFFAGAALVCLIFTGSLKAQTVISFRADSWYPYNGKPSDAKPGYAVELLKMIYEPKGFKVDYQIMPWKRAIADGETGQHNAIIGAIKVDAPTFVFPEEPVGTSDTTFFIKKEMKWKYDGIASLAGKQLGVVAGYSYGEPLDAYIKANAANPALISESSGDTASELGIKRLQAGRIDIYAETASVFWAQLDKQSISRDIFVCAGTMTDPEPIFVAFSPAKPESKDHAKMFSEGIRALRKSGELAKILAKYGISDWAK